MIVPSTILNLKVQVLNMYVKYNTGPSGLIQNPEKTDEITSKNETFRLLPLKMGYYWNTKLHF